MLAEDTHKHMSSKWSGMWLRVVWKVKWPYSSLSMWIRRNRFYTQNKFSFVLRIMENPSLFLVSNALGKSSLKPEQTGQAIIFRETHSTSQFGPSSLGAQETRQPRIGAEINLSFLSCVVWHHNPQIQPTLLTLFSNPFCAYSLIFLMLDSNLLEELHCPVILVLISNSFHSAHSTRFCGYIYCKP